MEIQPTDFWAHQVTPSLEEGPLLQVDGNDLPHFLKLPGVGDCDTKSNYSKSNYTSELKSNDGLSCPAAPTASVTCFVVFGSL